MSVEEILNCALRFLPKTGRLSLSRSRTAWSAAKAAMRHWSATSSTRSYSAGPLRIAQVKLSC